MSIAPANSASMADGPALNLAHCTFPCDPMALSNQPLDLPTIACGCVMLGNAPTRITLPLPWAHPVATNAKPSIQTLRNLLFTLVAPGLTPNHHGKNAARFPFFLRHPLSLGAFGRT